MAKFLQIIEFDSDKIDDTLALDKEWMKATEGKRTATHQYVCADRDNPGHYVVIVEFPSREAAEKNDKLPETQQFAEKQMKLSKGQPKFYNLDVLDEKDL